MATNAASNDNTASGSQSASRPNASSRYRQPTFAKGRILSAVTAELPPLSGTASDSGGPPA